MADGFGDADSVRRLGQALLSAGRGLAAATSDLSGRVRGLIPSGWSGDSADAFESDWSAKAQRAGELAAVCNHVGQVLTSLADELDAANQQATRAQQVTGGPASRFAVPSTEHKSQQMLSQASGAAQQARAAARAKLAGISVPQVGPPLSARQVTAWADRLAPPAKTSQPWYENLWHGAEHVASDIGGAGSAALNDLGQGAEGFFADGLLGTLKGLGDLAGMGPLYGDPSFGQAWDGMGHLVEPWNWDTFSRSWEGLGKGLLAWDEWKSDPSRAAGQVLFNVVTLPFVATKVLDAADAAAAAARAARVGAAADDAGDASKLGTAGRAVTAGKPLEAPRFSIGAKIGKQMASRGWTRESLGETIRDPARTVATRDTRWKPDGSRMNDPATAYINKDGSYVVVNDDSGDIVQVSNRNDPDWKAPWG